VLYKDQPSQFPPAKRSSAALFAMQICPRKAEPWNRRLLPSKMKNTEEKSVQIGSVDIQLEHVERPAVFHVKHVRYSRGHREVGRASSENQGFAGNTTGEEIFFRTKNWGILHSLQNRPSSMLFFGWNTSVPVTECHIHIVLKAVYICLIYWLH